MYDDYYDTYDDMLDDYDMRNARVRDRRDRHGKGAGLIRRPATGWPRPRGPIAPPAPVAPIGPRPVAVPVAVPVQERSGILGNLDKGELVEIVAQVLASLMPLPGAPAPSGSASTDTANHILYQQALAQHAKRDEQLRTLGSIVGKLID